MDTLQRAKAVIMLVLLASASFIVVLNIALPAMAAQNRNLAPNPPNCSSDSIFKWTLIGSPPSLNPNTVVTNTAGFIILGLEYTGMETVDPYGNVNSSYMVNFSHNADYTKWIFNVKPGQVWSDGTPITAADILATEGPGLALNSNYNYLGLAQVVTKAFAINKTAAEFDLNQSEAHLDLDFTLDSVPGANFMPAATVNAMGPSGPNLGTNVGNGPFQMYNFHAGDLQAVMYRNPYYKPQPKICEIQVNYVESLSLGAERLQSGQTDLAFISPTDASSILKTPNLHVLDEKGIGVASIEYNDSIAPYNNLAFRQALAYGINESEYVSQALSGYGIPAYNAQGTVSPIAKLWYDTNQVTYSFNQNKSLSLLASMGIKQGSDGMLHYQNGTAVSLNIWTDSANSEDLIGASVVQKDLSNLGFDVHLQVTSTSNLAGDYIGNLNGVRKGMIVFSAEVANPGVGYVDSFPAWTTYWAPPMSNYHWLYPPSVDAQYQGNATGIAGTDNLPQEQKYLNNIQELNAKYLPTIILGYPDELYGYSTQHWTNWPTGFFDEALNSTPNFTAWERLTPATPTSVTSTSTTQSASTVTSVSTSVATSVSTSVSTVTVSNSNGSSAPPSSGAGSNSAVYIAAAVIVIAVVVIGALLMRRKRAPTTS